jgi:membrane-associated protein
MNMIRQVIDLFLNLDKHLAAAVAAYGPYIYGILFVVIFCETGLVVTPFLPGDSLLFTAGALGAIGELQLWVLLLIFCGAAILGDTVNYIIGREFGHRIIESGKVRALRPEYIQRTQAFFERHGGKTIILARFFPIIRTFAPFMAGIGEMSLPRFWAFNVTGGILWVTLFTGAGYLFGNITFVREHLTEGILLIVAISFIPSIAEVVRHRLAQRANDTASQ